MGVPPTRGLGASLYSSFGAAEALGEWELSGTAYRDETGVYLDGTNNCNIELPLGSGVVASSIWSGMVEFYPERAATSSSREFLFHNAAPSAVGARANGIAREANTGLMYVVANSVVLGYSDSIAAIWRQYERNVVVWSSKYGSPGTFRMWMNGVLIMSVTGTTWTGPSALSGIIYGGAETPGGSTFLGRLGAIAVFPGELSLAEGLELSQVDAGAGEAVDLEISKSTLILPCRASYDGADGVEILKDADCSAIIPGPWGAATGQSKVWDADLQRYVLVVTGLTSYALQQNITSAGWVCRYRGWYRTVAGTPTAKIYESGAALMATLPDASEWTYFDFVWTNLYAAGGPYYFNTGAGTTQYRDLSVQRVRRITPAVGLASRRVLGPELLTDGNFEASGTAAWTASSSTLSKQSSDLGAPSTQCLRITDGDGNGQVWALQTPSGIHAGDKVFVSGYARLGGTLGGSAVASVWSDSTQWWLGTVGSTTWAYFETAVAVWAGKVWLGATNLGGATDAYVEFDQVSIKEILHEGALPRLGADGLTAASYPTLLTAPKGFSFDGGDYITIPDSNGFSFGDGATDSPFSVFLALRIGNTGIACDLVSKDNGSTSREFLFYITNGSLYVLLRDVSAGAYIGRASPATMISEACGTTRIVGFTCDGSGVSTGAKLYMDAVQIDTANVTSGSYTAMEPSAQDVKIGIGLAAYLVGTIYEPRIIPFELSARQVKRLTADMRARIKVAA